MTGRTRAQIDILQDQQGKDIAEIKESVRHIEEVVITGNGEIALREQIRKLSNWIGNVNKIALIFATVTIGFGVPMLCSLFFGLIIVLYNFKLFTP